MRFLRLLALFAAVTLAWSLTPVSSFAQSNGECLCTVPAGAASQPVGTIVNAIGQVQVSQAVGFTPGTTGTELFRGNRIIVGPQSNALITVGATCRLRIPENNDIVLEPVDGNICVWSREATGQAAGQQASQFDKVGAFFVGGFMLTGLIDIAASAW